MHIKKISISNILGIETLEFEAGVFTTISGDNGEGKTSIIESLKAVFEGGKDATLLRHGQKNGEIVLVFDDDTTIKRRITEKTHTTTVEKDGVIQTKPHETIRGWVDMLSVNPVDFLKAPKKDRLRVLLESLPMEADPERIQTIIGDETFKVIGRNALEQIDHAHQSVYDDRTGTNRAVREKDGSINQLRATLPPEDDDTPVGSVAELESQVATIEADRDEALAGVDEKLTGYRVKNATERDVIEAEMAAFQKQIDEIRAKVDEARDRLQVKKDWMFETEGKAEGRRAQIRAIAADKRAPLAAQIQVIRQNAGAASRAEQTRETIKVFEGELETLRADAERQGNALLALDNYKIELMAALPIEGLQIVDGEIYRNGTTFDRLNTAQQVEIAVEIAKIRAKDIGVICVDGLESLSPAHFEAFRDRAIESGLQLFVTRVTDGPLNIETE